MADLKGMGETRLSQRYAAALYALADERRVLSDVVEQMAALGSFIAGDRNLRRMIENPLTDSVKAAPVMHASLIAGGFLPIICDFVSVIATNRRLRDLPDLISGFAAYCAAKRGEIVADVTVAHEFTDLQRTQLRARLTEAGYSNVKLIEHLDPEILGGLVLKLGSRVYDTSLRSRLNRLTHSLKGAT